MKTALPFPRPAASNRNWEQSMVLPAPGSPRTRTTRPSGSPPFSIASSPAMPLEIFEVMSEYR
jgi:hypothetical protein